MPERRAASFRLHRSALPEIEAVEAETAHAFGRHTHEQFGVGLIDCGAQSSASGRGRVEAGAGDVITVNPGEIHDGLPLGAGRRRWRMLYLEPGLVVAAARDIEAGGDRLSEFVHPVITRRDAARRFARLYAAVTAPAAQSDEAALQERLLLLLAELLYERPIAGQPRAQGRYPESVLRARQRIDDDPAAPASLAELAALSGLSRYQLVRGFARATGFTPHAYRLQRRLVLARRLIAAGTPLAEAALASGFADQSHMTRLFVRAFGYSPGLYAAAVA